MRGMQITLHATLMRRPKVKEEQWWRLQRQPGATSDVLNSNAGSADVTVPHQTPLRK